MSLTDRDPRELSFGSTKDMVVHDLRVLAAKEEESGNSDDAEFFDEIANYILLKENNNGDN